MKKSLLVLVTILIATFVSCSKKSYDYEIINEESLKNIKTSLNIRLKEKVDKNALSEIANELYSSRKKYERVFIVYYLPGMEVNKGGWATSHFNPNLDIVILGFENDIENKLANDVEIIEGILLGKWIDNSSVGGIYYLTNNKGNYTMKIVYSDGSKSIDKLQKKTVSNKTRYIEKDNSFGEYYIINADSTLGIFDKDGLIRNIKKYE